ncbi:MAG: hypothetical protein KUG78_15425 [Kangiellaceae bacterium]|nr:hypothetical protein [Kangiellaceae bacterium]
MCEFVIGIDAGGSKTIAAIRNLHTGEIFERLFGPASLSHDLEKACQRIKKIADELMLEFSVKASQCVIVCGAAGAGCKENSARLSRVLGEGFFAKKVTTDAQTSLFGAGLGEPIIVVAIGTGSVAMMLDKSGREMMKGGWGFIAGDLGSGAEIGRQLVSRTLVEFDATRELGRKLRISDLIVNKVLDVIGHERQHILDWLKSANATRYAELAPIVFECLPTSKIANQIVVQAAADIKELVESFEQEKDLPVALIGGLGEKIKPFITAEINNRLIEEKGSALDGALLLAEQLLAERILAEKLLSEQETKLTRSKENKNV